MTPYVSFIVHNDLTELERVHQTFKQFGQDHQLPENLINTMNLATEEIFTNIIEHGFADGLTHFILIRIFTQNRALIVDIEDDGHRFNPLLVPDPNLDAPLETRPIGGLGIHIVRKKMDSLEYSTKEGKNCMRLVKKIDFS